MGASSCGQLETLNGGTIINSTIVNGQITNAAIQSSSFESGKVFNSTVENSTIVGSTMTDGQISGSTLTGVTEINSTVQNPTITGGTATDTKLSGSTIESLTKIDDASATLIASALASLPADDLAALAKAILSHQTVTPPSEIDIDKAVPTSSEDSITTVVAGNRKAILGEPDKWLQYGDGAVPVYNVAAKA